MKRSSKRSNEVGLKYVFTGEGKGKTSAALGVVVRSLLLGKKVTWISWYKSDDWQVSEMGLEKVFSDLLKMYWMGKGFYIKDENSFEREKSNKIKMAKVNQGVVVDYDTPEGHRIAAEEALSLAKKTIKEGDCWLVVLDEINQTISDGLLKISDIKKILRIESEVNIILTGRNFPKELYKEVDLVSSVDKHKHPFDSGVMARKGLDF